MIAKCPIPNTYQKNVLVTGWNFDGTQQKSLKYNTFIVQTLKTTRVKKALKIRIGIMIYHHNRRPKGQMFESQCVSMHPESSSGGTLSKSKYKYNSHKCIILITHR